MMFIFWRQTSKRQLFPNFFCKRQKENKNLTYWFHNYTLLASYFLCLVNNLAITRFRLNITSDRCAKSYESIKCFDIALIRMLMLRLFIFNIIMVRDYKIANDFLDIEKEILNWGTHSVFTPDIFRHLTTNVFWCIETQNICPSDQREFHLKIQTWRTLENTDER